MVMMMMMWWWCDGDDYDDDVMMMIMMMIWCWWCDGDDDDDVMVMVTVDASLMKTAADSLLPIVQSQRERFRVRAQELETVRYVSALSV